MLSREDINAKTAKQVIHFRTLRGMSQESLALSCGVSTTHIGDIERASKSPTVQMLYKITSALGITVSELFTFDEEKYDLTESEKDIERIYYALRTLSPKDISTVADAVCKLVTLNK